MTTYIKPITTIWGKGQATLTPSNISTPTAVLDKWYTAILLNRELVDTCAVISLIYQQCDSKEFKTFMDLWTGEYESVDTAYITRYDDEYYGDILVVGFEKGISDIDYYVFEVK